MGLICKGRTSGGGAGFTSEFNDAPAKNHQGRPGPTPTFSLIYCHTTKTLLSYIYDGRACAVSTTAAGFETLVYTASQASRSCINPVLTEQWTTERGYLYFFRTLLTSTTATTSIILSSGEGFISGFCIFQQTLSINLRPKP